MDGLLSYGEDRDPCLRLGALICERSHTYFLNDMNKAVRLRGLIFKLFSEDLVC